MAHIVSMFCYHLVTLRNPENLVVLSYVDWTAIGLVNSGEATT